VVTVHVIAPIDALPTRSSSVAAIDIARPNGTPRDPRDRCLSNATHDRHDGHLVARTSSGTQRSGRRGSMSTLNGAR
jgi:hypothetical protein